MVKITLEEGDKTIVHECECAFACLIRPAEAPEGSKAMACLLGDTSMLDLAKATAKTILHTFDHMSHGVEDVKDMALYEFLRALEEEENENPAKNVHSPKLPTKKQYG